jgi:hypothetical protein
MRSWENKVIAGAMVVFCGLMVAVLFMTASIKNKVCNCPGLVLTRNEVPVLDQLIHEKQSEIDSLSADSLSSIDDAARYLQDRYRRK